MKNIATKIIGRFRSPEHGKRRRGGGEQPTESPPPYEGPESSRRTGTPNIPLFIENDTYTVVKELHEGVEGHCTVEKSNTTGNLYVVKTTKPRHGWESGLGYPSDAVILLSRKPHPNIMNIFAATDAGFGSWRLILEHCSGGDLADLMLRVHAKFGRYMPTPEVFVLHAIAELVDALAYIHHGLRRVDIDGASGARAGDEGTTTTGISSDLPLSEQYVARADHRAVVHGDIKPDNILLKWSDGDHYQDSRRDGNANASERPYRMPTLVLADFGLAQFADESVGVYGTRAWFSPEATAVYALENTNKEAFKRAKSSRVLTTKSDVYGLGRVAWTLVRRRHRDARDDLDDLDVNIARDGNWKANGVKEAIRRCLQARPADRPDATAEGNEVDGGLLHVAAGFKRERDRLLKDERKWPPPGFWD